jgi:hypothetical protein
MSEKQKAAPIELAKPIVLNDRVTTARITGGKTISVRKGTLAYSYDDIAAEREWWQAALDRAETALGETLVRLDATKKLYAMEMTARKEADKSGYARAKKENAELKEDLEHLWCTAGVGCAQTRIRELINKHFPRERDKHPQEGGGSQK